MNRISKILLSLIGIIFGFASPVLAQYGAPSAAFKLQDKIMSDCGNVLNQISIQHIFNAESIYQASTTDSTGQFYFDFKSLRNSDIHLLIPPDDQHKFRSLDTLVSFEKFSRNAGGYFELSEPLELIVMTNEPCFDPKGEVKAIENKSIDPQLSGSNEILISEKVDWELIIFPNPSKSVFSYHVHSSNSLQAFARLVDSKGSIIYESEISIMEGWNSYTFQDHWLAKGNYWMTLQNTQQKISKQLIIE